MSTATARMPQQVSGSEPKALPRVDASSGGHIWRFHGTEKGSGLRNWLIRIGAPFAANRSYTSDVVFLNASSDGIALAHDFTDGVFVVLRSDYEGNGGIEAILRGKHEGLGEKPTA